MAKIGRLLCATGSLLVLDTGFAVAGPCTGQIAELERIAHMSGTSGAGASSAGPASTGATPAHPGAQGTAAQPPGISAAKGMMTTPGATATTESARPESSSPPSGSGTSASAPGPNAAPGGTGQAAGTAPGISATKGMAGGNASPTATVAPPSLATSAQDVRAQQQGQPTAAQAGSHPTSGGRAAADPQVMTALNNARQLDLQGKESECMQAVENAKRLVGSH